MSVCSGRGTRLDSRLSSIESHRQSSTFDACSEKIAKFTPAPSHVAPSGYGRPGQTLIEYLCARRFHSSRTRFGVARTVLSGNGRNLLESGQLSRGVGWLTSRSPGHAPLDKRQGLCYPRHSTL